MITLRPLRPSDKDSVLQWRNSPEVARYMYSDHVITAEEHDRWFSRVVAESGTSTSKYWVIEVDAAGIGLVNLIDINRHDRRCSWAFYIADETMRGAGIAPPLEYAVIEYVFTQMGFDKLCCEVLGSNEVVANLHKKLGFQQEGLLRQHIVKGVQRQDVIVLGMLKDDWLKLRDSKGSNRLRGKVTLVG